MSLSLWKPQRLSGLFGGDWMCPRRFEPEFASSLLSGLLAGCFNDGAERIAQLAGVFPVRVIDAPELVARTWSHGRAHGGN